MKNIPKKIYLQFYDGDDEDFEAIHEVKWSDERINNTYIEYILNDNDIKPRKIINGLKEALLKFGAITQWNAEALENLLNN